MSAPRLAEKTALITGGGAGIGAAAATLLFPVALRQLIDGGLSGDKQALGQALLGQHFLALFGIACTHLFQGVPHEFPFVLDDMRIRFDAFAEQETDHAGHFDRGASVLLGSLDGVADGQVRVDDESLREKSDFLEELAHAAFDHLLDDPLPVGDDPAIGGGIGRAEAEHGHFGAQARQLARRGFAEPRAAAGDEGGVSLNVHGVVLLFKRFGFR